MQWKQPFLYINWASGFWQENKEKREDVNSGQFNLCYFCYFCMGRPSGWPRPDGHGGWPNACGWVWPRPAGHGPCGWRVWPRCLHCAPSLLQTRQCKQCMHKQLVWRSRGFSSRLHSTGYFPSSQGLLQDFGYVVAVLGGEGHGAPYLPRKTPLQE